MQSSPLSKTTYPVCSLARARELGLDVSKVLTCAPSPQDSNDPSVAGCPQWRNCPFDKPGYGTFKGQGPQYIGYYLRTIEDRVKTEICNCYTFVTTLLAAQRDGLQARVRGDSKFETVKIVAHQGESIEIKYHLKRAKKDGTSETYYERKRVVIPPMPDPGEVDPFLEFERDIAAEFESGIADSISVPNDTAQAGE